MRIPVSLAVIGVLSALLQFGAPRMGVRAAVRDSNLYNGAFAACPDPIDFRAYTIVNLYKDTNAYTLKGEASAVERPAFRNYLGEVFVISTRRSRLIGASTSIFHTS